MICSKDVIIALISTQKLFHHEHRITKDFNSICFNFSQQFNSFENSSIFRLIIRGFFLDRKRELKACPPQGEISTIPIPDPIRHEDPSKKRVHGAGSTKLRSGLQWWVTKSASTYPLISLANSKCKSNYDKAGIHFPILSFKFRYNMYFTTSSLLTTTHSVDSK